MTELHQLYRYYDKDDVLLYVGISNSIPNRQSGHKNRSSWFSDVTSSIVENHVSRRILLAAERLAISWENPKYNIQGKKKRFLCSDPQKLFLKRNMRRALEESGISQADMAKRLNVSKGAVGHWVTDNQDYLPKISNFVEFCRICKVTPNDMLGDCQQDLA